MKKKGSVFMTAFVIAVAIAIVIILNISPKKLQQEEMQPELEEKAEAVSGTLYHALENSEARATYETGLDLGYWLSYSLPLIPDVEEIKLNLSTMIKEFINLYLDELRKNPDVEISPDLKITDIIVNVDESSVLNYNKDTSFDVTAVANEEIIFTGEGGEVHQKTSFNVPVDNWRFWYFYRVIRNWINENSYARTACNNMPEYGITGNKNCHYKQVDEVTAEEMLNDAVNELIGSFDRDYQCVYNCPDLPDPDCNGEAIDEPDPGCEEGDNYCSQECLSPDPDCDKCNIPDPFIECSYEIICDRDPSTGKTFIDTNIYDVKQSSCKSNDCCTDAGYCDSCPAFCVDTGCNYGNDNHDCEVTTCNDHACPRVMQDINPDLVPPCNKGLIIYEGGDYDGNKHPDHPKTDMGNCGGTGTEYFWSQIVNITCIDNSQEKPISATGNFEKLQFSFLMHTYFSRSHPVLNNDCPATCVFDEMCFPVETPEKPGNPAKPVGGGG
ncbi:hypothetical protein JXB41_02120 [Candidatus Woesearchaeota archaeon]|nr:hypothetical protein [Candidatus Woesearchaeota archaeon]